MAVIVILGMHRSGTSLLAETIAGLGAQMGPPEPLGRPAFDNGRGFWEHPGIMATQRDLLAALGRELASPEAALAMPPNWLDHPAARHARRRLTDLLLAELAALPRGGQFAFKDPRTCLLLPLWQHIFAELGLAPRHVLALRHPAEVAASLHRRDGIPPVLGEALWLRHHAEALRHLAGRPLLTVRYDALLAHPADSATAMAQALGLAPTGAAPADPALRHHHAETPAQLPLAEALFQVLAAPGNAADLGQRSAGLLAAFETGMAFLGSTPALLHAGLGDGGPKLPGALPLRLPGGTAAEREETHLSARRVVLRHGNAWCENLANGFKLHANAPGAAPVRLSFDGLPAEGGLRFSCDLALPDASEPMACRLRLLAGADQLVEASLTLVPGAQCPWQVTLPASTKATATLELEVEPAAGAAHGFHASVWFLSPLLERVP